MTRWTNLSKKQAKKLGLEGFKELDDIEKEERKKAVKKMASKKFNKNNIPLEEEEQRKLAEYLDYQGYDWFHPFNEGKHKVQYRAKQKKLGLKSGIPDVIIFNAPEKYNGIAIELKRQKGGQLTDNQKKWLNILDSLNWLTKVAHGADEAINWLENIFEV